MIPYGKQSISAADVEEVVKVLRSDFLTQGPKVGAFEEAFAAMCGARYAVACSSGTAALHLALLSASIGAHDQVITSPTTFLASANCAAYVGAVPDFSDIDPVSYCLSPESLAENWKSGTRAVVAVDYAGQSADMEGIADLARRHGAVVIEDGCHAVGGGFVRKGKLFKVGGHPWADITCFSLHPVKTLTSGEGGMLVTDNENYAVRARRLRSHGMERSAFVGLGAEDDDVLGEQGPWYYEMQELGYNYRITDIQCALGLSQLARLPEFVARRREIVNQYNESFSDIEWLTIPGLRVQEDRDYVSWHLYTVQIDFPAIGRTRTEVMNELRAKGIGTQVLYIPVYLQPWYRETYGYRAGKCPNAEMFYGRALSLPLFSAMTDEDVETVIAAVEDLKFEA